MRFFSEAIRGLEAGVARSSGVAWIACAVVAALVFATDLIVPRGVAGGVPYVAVVAASFWVPGLRATAVAAVGCTALIAMGWSLSVQGGTGWMVLSNRVIAVAVVWTAAVLVGLQKRTVEAVRYGEERFSDFAELSADWFWELDRAGAFIYVSGRHEAILGVSADQLLGRRFRDVLEERAGTGDDRREVLDRLAGRLRFEDLVISWKRPDRHTRKLSLSGRPVTGPLGAGLGFRGTARDVTDEYRYSQRLEHQASHDPLTGLVNRREFERRLGRAVRSARRRGVTAALCFLDLDNFKPVNDEAGHDAGDELLKRVAKLLSERVRRRDTAARVGGDEFSLLLEGCTLEDAEDIADGLVEGIGAMRFRRAGRAFQIGVSVGVVAVAAAYRSAGALIKAADAACYRAKRAGGARVIVDPGESGNSAQVRRRSTSA